MKIDIYFSTESSWERHIVFLDQIKIYRLTRRVFLKLFRALRDIETNNISYCFCWRSASLRGGRGLKNSVKKKILWRKSRNQIKFVKKALHLSKSTTTPPSPPWLRRIMARIPIRQGGMVRRIKQIRLGAMRALGRAQKICHTCKTIFRCNEIQDGGCNCVGLAWKKENMSLKINLTSFFVGVRWGRGLTLTAKIR